VSLLSSLKHLQSAGVLAMALCTHPTVQFGLEQNDCCDWPGYPPCAHKKAKKDDAFVKKKNPSLAHINWVEHSPDVQKKQARAAKNFLKKKGVLTGIIDRKKVTPNRRT